MRVFRMEWLVVELMGGAHSCIRVHRDEYRCCSWRKRLDLLRARHRMAQGRGEVFLVASVAKSAAGAYFGLGES